MTRMYIKISFIASVVLVLLSITTLIKAFVPRFPAFEIPFILYPISGILLITFGSFLTKVLKAHRIWGILILLYGVLIIFSIFYALQSEV